MMTKAFLLGDLLVFILTTTLSLGETYEGQSSYYLITNSGEASSSDSFEVYRALDEFGCMSLCNNKDGCAKGVYDHDRRSCFLEMDGCKKRKENNRGEAILSTGENFVLFNKLGRTFDLKERKFQGEPAGMCISSTPLSCKEIYDTNRLAQSGVYSVFPEGVTGQKVQVYCHMTEIPGCGKGGWTLVMKIDGAKDTFRYNSRYWNSTVPFQPSSALKGLDHNEALSPAYWTIPQTKLCLGMKQNLERGMALNWILYRFTHAQTLHSLISDGGYRFTNLGRKEWLSLMVNSSLGPGCADEGFNPSMIKQRVRIGMVAGEKCLSPTWASLFGFGSTGNYSCGNLKGDDPSKMKYIPSFGYILVQ